MISAFSTFNIIGGGDDGNTDLLNTTTVETADSLSYEVAKVDTPPAVPNPNTEIGDPINRDYDIPFFLGNPSNIETEFELSDDGKGFEIHEKIGDIDIRRPSYMSLEDYLDHRKEEGMNDYWKDRVGSAGDPVAKALKLGIDINNPAFRDIFGGGGVEIRPNGTALLEFSGEINRMQNPALPLRAQRTGSFNFNQNIQLNVVGKIGEKLRLTANWDTQASFDFENQFKIEYTGTEDEIIQKIEGGNVSLPLKGSLIQGGQNLFGIKTALKFGPLVVTTVASQQKGKRKSVDTQGGSQVTQFEKKANDYHENRHFFIGHHFRNRYETALARLPNINSGYQFIPNRIEVWITNTNSASTVNNRNAVGFVDMGEQDWGTVDGSIGRVFNDTLWNSATGASFYPDNKVNGLYDLITGDDGFRNLSTVDDNLQASGLRNGVDYEKVENMRLLRQEEFSFNEKLGYIMLNTQVQANQVLFVAYEYTINGEIHSVGEFSQDKPASENPLLFLKMLKPSSVRPEFNNKPYPTWDLNMKNVYSIGGYGLRGDNFDLQIFYQSPTTNGDIRVLPESKVASIPLIQVTKLDQLTNNSTAQADNQFDFIEGVTVFSDRGMIVFPVLEPFGSHLVNAMDNVPEDSAKFAFPQLYRKTKMDAIQLHQDVDRYIFKGSYQSASSSEISLNAINIAPGSVTVTANGRALTEGSDYNVDYTIGKVTILNQGLLTSGEQIKVDFETNTLFGIESKTMVGSRFDINVDEDIQLGATVLHLNERPLTNKILLGEEPVSNTIWGVDALIKKDSRLLTKIIDKLPLLQTKEISSVTGMLEFAQLLPGHPRAIKVKDIEGEDEDGITYLDDFESAKTTFSLKGFRSWSLASFPGDNGNNELVDLTGIDGNELSSGYTRAKLSWYTIDSKFFFNNPNIDFPDSNLSDHYMRIVNPKEVFPNRTLIAGDNLLPTFDLHYVPSERGPYNFNADPTRIDANGKFVRPEDSWAGIARRTSGNTDFEASNYEFLEFWLLDPFIYEHDKTNSGKLFLNFGKISEDVLPDNRRSFENGLPENGNFISTDSTAWGVVPEAPAPNLAFSNDREARPFQDVGFDGLANDNEATYFSDFLDRVSTIGLTTNALDSLLNDPASDDYTYFLDPSLDKQAILDRYKNFNNPEGNTPVDAIQNGLSVQGSPNPDTEDLNANGTLNTEESYWEYPINLSTEEMMRGRNFIVDEIRKEITLKNGTDTTVTWFQFRVPLSAGTPIGGIQNFKSIDYVRMYMTGFQDEVTLRFGEFQLVSTSWRTYKGYLGRDEEVTPIEPPVDLTTFEIGTVNIEENGSREPFPYILPPNVQRQQQIGSIQQQGILQNEQAIVMKACNLADGDARGAYKVQNLDLRSFEKVKMWIHAEPGIPGDYAGSNFENTGDLAAFIRLGSDNSENYYEYEIPLTPTQADQDYPPTNSTDGIIPSDQIKAWLPENQFNFKVELFNEAKSRRNQELTDNPNLITTRFLYTNFDDSTKGHRIHVVGTPKLSEVRSIMIGIRNPDDTGGPVCAEVWMNELRMVNFNERAGYAATARMNIKLADFGTVTLSGMMKTPGFGSLDSRILTRSREMTYQYDVAGNFQLGKFFPKKWGIEVPLYVTYGEKFVTPEYNPLESDVLSESYIKSIEDPVEQEEQKDAIRTHIVNKSISVTNIRKNRTDTKKKQRPWDIENISASFSYAEQFKEDHITDSNKVTTTRASFKYGFNLQPKLIRPFAKWKRKNPISMFNFYLYPKAFTFNISGNRRFEYNQLRQNPGLDPIRATYNRNFQLSRTSNLQWDLTQSLRVTYNTAANSRVDEPLREITDDTDKDSLWYNNLISFRPQAETDPTLIDSLGFWKRGRDNYINLGRAMNYSQNTSVNYVLPFDKFTWTNWLSGSVSYTGGLNWNAAPDNNPQIGNLLSNSMSIQGNARVSLDKLYDKIPGFKKFMQSDLTKNKKEDPKDKDKDKKGKKDSKTTKGPKAPDAEEDADSTNSFVFLKMAAKGLLGIITSVKNVDVQYSRNNSTNLPGYMPNTDNFGLDWNHKYQDDVGNWRDASTPPPTAPFIFGWQYTPIEILQYAENDGWISKDPAFTNFFGQNQSEQMTGRTSVTLFKDFRIDINANLSRTKSYSSLMRWDDALSEFVLENEVENGTYSSSYIWLTSSFENSNAKNDWFSKSFEEFSNARREISGLYAASNPNFEDVIPDSVKLTSDEYRNGYYANSQDVLISSFLTSYGPMGAGQTVKSGAFPAIPLPNWTVNYNGLSKLKAVKKIMNQFTVKHSYRGTYSVSGFNTNARAELDGSNNSTSLVGVDYDPILEDTIYNFRPQYNVPTISMTESFAPLIGLNATFNNGITASFDYKTTRNITFNVGSLQVNETRSNDISISVGWRTDKLNKTVTLFKREIQLKNSLNTRFEMTLRDRVTQNRTLDSTAPQSPTGGNLSLIIKPTIDYTVNAKLNVMFFVESNINRPKISTSFPTSFTSIGFRIRFTL